MRIKAIQLLKVEEAPKEQQGWIGKFLGPLNQFITQGVSILNGGILFADNIVGQDFVYTFTYVSDAISFPVSFRWNLPMPPVAFQVCSALEDGTSFVPVVAWKYASNGTVQLTSVFRITSAPAVSALQNGKVYKIRVRVTP